MRPYRAKSFRLCWHTTGVETPPIDRTSGSPSTIAMTERKCLPTSTWHDILTQDDFPSINPYVRWIWTPLGCLGLTSVAAGLCGWILHPQGLVVFVGILSVICFVVAWPWLGLRGVHSSITFDRDRAREGDNVQFGYHQPGGTRRYSARFDRGERPPRGTPSGVLRRGKGASRCFADVVDTLDLGGRSRASSPVHPTRVEGGAR